MSVYVEGSTYQWHWFLKIWPYMDTAMAIAMTMNIGVAIARHSYFYGWEAARGEHNKQGAHSLECKSRGGTRKCDAPKCKDTEVSTHISIVSRIYTPAIQRNRTRSMVGGTL